LLAGIGIYGVLAYSVAQRTREIGIRIAVGARHRHIMGMVISDGARWVGLGVMVGVTAALGLTRFLRHQLFGVSPLDPDALSAAILLLLGVALLASYLPARRAAKVDPMIALRAE
jgi:ABC-type antimicrobial peptide transport system permease subunit